jgi:hypothetical protein
MENVKKYWIVVVVAAVVGGILIWSLPGDSDQPANVTDFHSCLEAGYPIMESYPAQCRTPDGRLFVEDLSEQPEVVIDTPTTGQVVSSPLTVSGKAKGTCFFEANLPITLKDTNGTTLAQVGAQAQGEWMTEDYVNFSAVLQFGQPQTEYGVLLIEKDNPSGLPEFDASFAVPVRFR